MKTHRNILWKDKFRVDKATPACANSFVLITDAMLGPAEYYAKNELANYKSNLSHGSKEQLK